MKKVTGDAAPAHYETFDEYGVVDYRRPEFNVMSRRPGIGAGWFAKYKSDVFPSDHVIVNGRPCKVPRYYDNIFKVESPLDFDAISYERFLNAQNRIDDNTSGRLSVKETVAISRLSRLKRSL